MVYEILPDKIAGIPCCPHCSSLDVETEEGHFNITVLEVTSQWYAAQWEKVTSANMYQVEPAPGVSQQLDRGKMEIVKLWQLDIILAGKKVDTRNTPDFLVFTATFDAKPPAGKLWLVANAAGELHKLR